MEFKMNLHSSKTMDDLKAEFAKEDKKREEMEKAHRREFEKNQREFDRTHGFKTRYEIIKYLKDGNVIGVFRGLYGENDQSNNFFYWDVEESAIKHHFQISDGYDCDFWMTTRTLSNEDFIQWLKRLDEIVISGSFMEGDWNKNN